LERALELTWRLDAPLRSAQSRAILSVLSKRMLALFRKASMNPDKIPETPAARNTRLFLEAQGRKRGRLEGRAEGRAEGLTQGEVKGKQDALLALLKARGLSISAEQRAGLRSCADPAKLTQWIVRAATAASASDVLGTTTQGAAPRAPRRRSTNSNSKARSRAARRP
jgi:hypothetical protein